MRVTEKELLALAAKWRERARTFTRAHESENLVDSHRLVGMASSLRFASDELCFTARLNPNDEPAVANARADHAVSARSSLPVSNDWLSRFGAVSRGEPSTDHWPSACSNWIVVQT